jgi:hypothetical protein
VYREGNRLTAPPWIRRLSGQGLVLGVLLSDAVEAAGTEGLSTVACHDNQDEGC